MPTKYLKKQVDRGVLKNPINIRLHEHYDRLLIKMAFVEFWGTFFLVFIGCGGIISTDNGNGMSVLVKAALNNTEYALRPGIGAGDYAHGFDLTNVAFCFGFLIVTLVWNIHHTGAGNMNPAVTIAMTVTGHCSVARCGIFVFSQVVGAIAGAAMLKLFFIVLPPHPFPGAEHLGANHLVASFGENKLVAALLMEVFVTYMLVFTVFATHDANRIDLEGSRPMTLGVMVIMLVLFSANVSTCGMNPARSFGPALVANSAFIWNGHWVYWAGPILGGILAGITYEMIFAAPHPEHQKRDIETMLVPKVDLSAHRRSLAYFSGSKDDKQALKNISSLAAMEIERRSSLTPAKSGNATPAKADSKRAVFDIAEGEEDEA